MTEEYARKTLSKDCCDLKLVVYKRTINSYLAGAEFGYNKANEELTERLDEAKEIIKQLLDRCYGYNSITGNYEVKAKAEAFLGKVNG